jgi:lipopolysaccharide/colanic/teichoic acid biosynthesis glycosyltransferase
MKRAFDLTLAICGLIILSPLLIALMGAIWHFDGRPCFFRQVRVGRNGVHFRIWKFRTMVCNAQAMGGELTVGRDTRITPIGKWLRKTKLDELPQLINIVCGEMSFVGPRPEVPFYVEKYTAEQRRVLELLPGITDEASIQFRDENEQLAREADPESAYLTKVMPEKIRLNLAYAQRANVIRDTGVILRTFAKLAA